MKVVGKEILKLGPKFVLMKGGNSLGDAINVLIGMICLRYLNLNEVK